jgi:hypothetical protein
MDPPTTGTPQLHDHVTYARGHFAARMTRVVFSTLRRIVISVRKTATFELSPQGVAHSRGSASEFMAHSLLHTSHVGALGYSLQTGQNRGKTAQNNAVYRHTPPKPHMTYDPRG